MGILFRMFFPLCVKKICLIINCLIKIFYVELWEPILLYTNIGYTIGGEDKHQMSLKY